MSTIAPESLPAEGNRQLVEVPVGRAHEVLACGAPRAAGAIESLLADLASEARFDIRRAA